MASQEDTVAGAAATPPDTTPIPPSAHAPTADRPMKMSDLPSDKDASAPDTAATTTPTQTTPRMTRQQSEALEPATEAPIAHLAPNTTGGPTVNISLMLTTGARHPYKIDEKYLLSRKVLAQTAQGTFDPREISGYQLKELIWTDWRNEWETRPASPSSIRLIIMGRMIEDKSALKDFPFKMDHTNVVHMTIKPADVIDDEEAAGKGTAKGGPIRAREGGDRGAGCRCVIL